MEEPAPKHPCFAFSSASQRCGLVSDAVPPNTKKATNTWVSVLQEYVFMQMQEQDPEKSIGASLLAARGAINHHVQNFQAEMNLFSRPSRKRPKFLMEF